MLFSWPYFLLQSYFKWPLIVKQQAPQKFISQMKWFNIFWNCIMINTSIVSMGFWKLAIRMRLHSHFREVGAHNDKGNCINKYDWLWKKHKNEWQEVVKTSGRTPSSWKWYEQCEFWWGCIPKVAGMLDVMENGTQVPYTWQTIDLEKYEQYWPKEQDPIFDLNEDYEVVSLPRKVYGHYSTP